MDSQDGSIGAIYPSPGFQVMISSRDLSWAVQATQLFPEDKDSGTGTPYFIILTVKL